MGRQPVRLSFARLPSASRSYPRALFARRSGLLPDGTSIPRIEGEAGGVVAGAGHLRRFREACGFAPDGQLPVAYPHVLAMPLHIAMLTRPEFVVRLMGLIHVANEIEWLRPMPEGGEYSLRAWVEGHEETDRGQEFHLHTEMSDSGGVAWRESCTLLARRQASGVQASRTGRATLRAPKPPAGAAVTEVTFSADHRIARQYGRVSGDLNPIHLADFTARRYGFDRAVAHGMWSMARSLAALGPALTSAPCRIPVEFKLPLFLPSQVRLQHWHAPGGAWTFVLRDGNGTRPHLAGSVERS
jgi:acyl dehydratase